MSVQTLLVISTTLNEIKWNEITREDHQLFFALNYVFKEVFIYF